MSPLHEPYIRKIEEVSPFTVWEVSGPYIREKLSPEFTNFGQHYAYKFIPKHEFWIDKEHAPSECDFFVDHLLTEFKLMDKGEDYAHAHTKACQVESRERHKSDLFRKGLKKDALQTLIDKIHKEKLISYSNDNIAVWVVNREAVRDRFFVDFTEGGHDYVYNFVPKGEVWLDDDLGQNEDRRFVLLHELHERALMATRDYPYLSAHHSAIILEHKCRHNPKLLEESLKEALEQNRSI